MAKGPHQLNAKSAVRVSGKLLDEFMSSDVPYVPPPARDDPRLDRDHTRTARTIDISRPNSWAAMSRKRK